MYTHQLGRIRDYYGIGINIITSGKDLSDANYVRAHVLEYLCVCGFFVCLSVYLCVYVLKCVGARLCVLYIFAAIPVRAFCSWRSSSQKDVATCMTSCWKNRGRMGPRRPHPSKQ